MVERLLSGVAKRRVPQVVGKGDGFDEVLIEPKRTREVTANLRYLERMLREEFKMGSTPIKLRVRRRDA